jgi:hypothetical protein
MKSLGVLTLFACGSTLHFHFLFQQQSAPVAIDRIAKRATGCLCLPGKPDWRRRVLTGLETGLLAFDYPKSGKGSGKAAAAQCCLASVG